MSIFVVAGATGHVGSVVARELLAAGHKVRAIVRSVEKAKALAGQGAELLAGELSDVGFLTRALRGADGAFLLLPPPANDAPDVRGSAGSRRPRRGGRGRRERHPSRRPPVVVGRREGRPAPAPSSGSTSSKRR